MPRYSFLQLTHAHAAGLALHRLIHDIAIPNTVRHVVSIVQHRTTSPHAL